MRCLLAMVFAGAVRAVATLPGPFAPAADEPGSTAVGFDDERIVRWASAVTEIRRGYESIDDPAGDEVSWGVPQDALGPSDVLQNDLLAVVSLGDGGSITLTFGTPIGDGPGPDLAVFENGFAHENGSGEYFLELGFVEVSSNGTSFHRFPAISLTQTDTQLNYLGTLHPTNLHNFAGKYRRGFGTPFDFAELAGIEDLDISQITHVRIVDVVGSLDPAYRSLDSLGNPVNDPWETAFETGGFDLDAVAYLSIPEPGAPLLGMLGAAWAGLRRRRQP